ncbi:GDP-mannose 4,6-dehydratase [Thermoproteota archaeon]
MKKRLLLIEDEHDIAQIIASRLENHGFEVNQAHSGKEALKFIQTNEIDLILLDVFMPDANGYELAKQLKENPKTAGVPIVMLTADSSQEDKVKALKSHVDDFINKPFIEEELVARLEALLRRSETKQMKKSIINILITGGAGFIGSYLAKRLIEDNYHVHILDDFSTGRMENLEEIKDSEYFHLTTGSVTDEVLVSKLIEKCDYVYHLAATVGVKNVVDNPLDTIIYDVIGSEIVLKYASAKGIRVLLTSTSEVYGKTTQLPFTESSDIVLGPPDINRWSYACSKLLDEFLAMAYYRQRNLQVSVVRFFNIVGPRQLGEYGMVIPRFFNSAIKNEPIYVYGDGEQSRCFTYVEDAVDIIIKLANTDDAYGQVVNLGSNNEIKIKDLAKKVKEISNSQSEIIFEPYEKYYGKSFQDIRRRVPDVTKLKNLIGSVPTTTMDDIINKMNQHYQGNPIELMKVVS